MSPAKRLSRSKSLKCSCFVKLHREVVLMYHSLSSNGRAFDCNDRRKTRGGNQTATQIRQTGVHRNCFCLDHHCEGSTIFYIWYILLWSYCHPPETQLELRNSHSLRHSPDHLVDFWICISVKVRLSNFECSGSAIGDDLIWPF